MAATAGASPRDTGAGATPWDAAHATALVQKANPYVHVINYHAVIDPALKAVVSSQDYAAVAAQVDRYNSEPLSERSLNATASTTAVPDSGIHTDACNNSQPAVRVVNNWYGPSVYTNDCVTQSIRNQVVLGVAIAAAFKYYGCGWLGLEPPAVAVCVTVATAIQVVGGLTAGELQLNNKGNGVWWNDVFGVPTITSA